MIPECTTGGMGGYGLLGAIFLILILYVFFNNRRDGYGGDGHHGGGYGFMPGCNPFGDFSCGKVPAYVAAENQYLTKEIDCIKAQNQEGVACLSRQISDTSAANLLESKNAQIAALQQENNRFYAKELQQETINFVGKEICSVRHELGEIRCETPKRPIYWAEGFYNVPPRTDFHNTCGCGPRMESCSR